MKTSDGLVLLFLFWACRRGGGAAPSSPSSPSSPSPSLPTAPSSTPGTITALEPGVYWWCCASNEAEALVAWLQVNTGNGNVGQVKLLGSNGVDCAVVLFDVLKPTAWTLSGVPQEAEFGMVTELEDLKPITSMSEFFRRKARQAVEAVRAFDARLQQYLDRVLRPAPSP